MNDSNYILEDIEKIFSRRAPGIISEHGHFSVLVPFVEKDGELNLLFEVRASGLKRQPGDICFPGGKVENGETAEECAARETVEELGVKRGGIKIVNRFDDVYTHDKFIMHSFIGEIGYCDLLKAEINHREVESVFFVPFSDFLEKGLLEPPVYKYGDKTIWGLTARIVLNIVKAIGQYLPAKSNPRAYLL